MSAPDCSFSHPSWKALSDGDIRVLIALSLSKPNRLSMPALLRAYQPQKAGTDSLMAAVVARLQPAVATFGAVIVREGKGYRLSEKHRLRREVPKTPDAAPPAPAGPAKAMMQLPKVAPMVAVAPPVLAPPVGNVTADIIDLAGRRYSPSQIAARLRVPYAEVERVLAGGGR